MKKKLIILILLVSTSISISFANEDILIGASSGEEAIIKLFFDEYSEEINNYGTLKEKKETLEENILTLTGEHNQVLSELEEAESENTKLLEEISKLKTEKENISNTLETIKADKNLEISNLESENQSLKAQLEEALKEPEDQPEESGETGPAPEEDSELVENLKSQIEFLEQGLASLEDVDKTLKLRDAEIVDLKAQISSQLEEIDKLKNQENDIVEEPEEPVDTTELDKLNDQLNEKDIKINELENDKADMSDKLSDLEDTIFDLKDTISKSGDSKEIDKLKSKVEEAEDNLEYYREALVHGLQNNTKIVEVTKEVEVEVEDKALLKENKILKNRVAYLERKVEALTKLNNNGLNQEELKYIKLEEENINKESYQGKRNLYLSRIAKTMNKLYENESNEPEAVDLSDVNLSFKQWVATDISELPFRDLFNVKGYYDKDFMLDYVIIERR